MAHKALNIYYLVPYRESLPTLFQPYVLLISVHRAHWDTVGLSEGQHTEH